jgi:hypothetical protein
MIRIHPLWWGGGDASISKMLRQSLDGAQVVRERGEKAVAWVLGGGGGRTSKRTLVEHVRETELVVTAVWILEIRREDEPERNVFIYATIVGSMKSFIVDIVYHTFVVVHAASDISGSYHVTLANKGNVNYKFMHCGKIVSSKRANLIGRCSPGVDQEICSDCASTLVGFQILNKRTVLVSGSNQTRGGLLRHSRLYGTALVIITTCLVCNHCKCQLILFRL